MSAPTSETEPTARAAGNAAWARRRRALRSSATQFAAHRSGIVGAVLLAVVVVLALLTPWLLPSDSLAVTKVTAAPNEAPSGGHWLGTDTSGRDVIGLLLWGARASLLVGLTATAMSMAIGTVVGMAAGYFGGVVQAILMRVVDFFLVVPSLVLAIVLSTVLGAGLWTIVIAIGVTSWASTARLVRSQTLTVASRGYVERSRALGAGDGHILLRHVLPAVLPLVLANTTLTVGSAIIAESTLAFLGLGDPTTYSWGSMLKRALDTGAATAGFWWQVMPPGLAIVLVVLCFTLVGRALEAVVNPALRGEAR